MEQGQQDHLMEQNESCRHCDRIVMPDDRVRLWDEQWYCRRCVDAVCPELFDYATHHDQLEEAAPYDRGAIWRSAFRMEGWIVLFFASLLGVIGYGQNGVAGAVIGIVAAVIVAIPQATIQLPMLVWLTRRNLPTVCVSDGKVTIRREGCGRRFCRNPLTCTIPLQNFKWRMGRSRQDSGLRNTIVPKQSVVLLVLRYNSKWAWLLGEGRIACGWTAPMQRIWKGFLTLAAVPEDSRKKRTQQEG